jgi:hypothetical protein
MRPFNINWNSDGAMFFGTAASGRGQVVFRLVVERLPGESGWDWSVWQTDRPGTIIGRGTAPSSAIARANAEEAARAWDPASRP